MVVMQERGGDTKSPLEIHAPSDSGLILIMFRCRQDVTVISALWR